MVKEMMDDKIKLHIADMKLNVGIKHISDHIEAKKGLVCGGAYFKLSIGEFGDVRVQCLVNEHLFFTKEDKWILDQANWVLGVDKKWTYICRDHSQPTPRRMA